MLRWAHFYGLHDTACGCQDTDIGTTVVLHELKITTQGGVLLQQVLACIEPGPDEILLPKTSSSVFCSTNVDYILRRCRFSQKSQLSVFFLLRCILADAAWAS